jgi:hypothetical protein
VRPAGVTQFVPNQLGHLSKRKKFNVEQVPLYSNNFFFAFFTFMKIQLIQPLIYSFKQHLILFILFKYSIYIRIKV